MIKNKILVAVSVVFICSCAPREDGPSSTTSSAATGGALGAGLGAVVGNQVGDPGSGVAIGSAFGAVSGGMIGSQLDAQDDRIKVQDEALARQQQELAENRRILEELRERGTEAQITERGIEVHLPDVFFQFGKSKLTPKAFSKAEEIAEIIRETAGPRKISVEGHTDSIGSIEANRKLSYNRARSVANVLALKSISPERIHIRGFGESKPVDTNETAEGRQQNRRVEVIVENYRR